MCCRIEAEAGSRGHRRYRRLVISKRHGHRRRSAVLVPALRLAIMMAHRLREHLVRKHAATRCMVVSIRVIPLLILLRHNSSSALRPYGCKIVTQCLSNRNEGFSRGRTPIFWFHPEIWFQTLPTNLETNVRNQFFSKDNLPPQLNALFFGTDGRSSAFWWYQNILLVLFRMRC